MGLHFKNKVGLAAGFDKNASYLKVWEFLGFGHVEIGTVTPIAQDGNDKPRLFRIVKDEAIINRMGFNNVGLNQVLQNIKNQKTNIILGCNIGKNKNTANELAYEDYCKGLEVLYEVAHYFVINISSPNTPGLRALQSSTFFNDLITRILNKREELILKYQYSKPILIKLAPDLELNELKDLCKIINESNIEGIVCNNTSIGRQNLSISNIEIEKIGNGGLSGKPILEISETMITHAKSLLNPDKIIIGVGGIYDATSGKKRLDMGANLVQLYSGFIYKGPQLIYDINT